MKTIPHTIAAASALFLGSLLAFWLELMSARLLLPAFGSSAGVWIACLGVFQVLLLLGYAYGFLLSHLPWKVQRVLHLGVLLVACVWTVSGKLTPGMPDAASAPWWAVTCLLVRMAAIVFGVLSAGSLLLQNWVVRGANDRGVYRLYAWSNAGSFAGLLLYPLVLEPFLGLDLQRALWSGLFVIDAGIVAWLALGRNTDAAAVAAARGPDDPHVPLPAWLAHPAWWFALPAVSGAWLVAMTNHVTLEFTPLPLVWAILLGAYLLSFVLAFSRFAERHLAGLLLAAATAAVSAPFFHSESGGGGAPLLFLGHGFAVLLLCGWWLHGWLYAIRPPPAKLPAFYLAVAAGGACGGALVSFGAPLVFDQVAEYPLLLAAIILLLGGFVASGGAGFSLLRVRVFLLALLLVPLAGVVRIARQQAAVPAQTVLSRRSFYGVVQVKETRIKTARRPEGSTLRSLLHGHTLHGEQALIPEWRTTPTAYYAPGTGIGQLLLQHPKRQNNQPMQVGIVGLGIGTLAAYGRPGDDYTWYEINRQVIDIATNAALFTYLTDSRAAQHIVPCDARKAIEYELTLPGLRRFDVLVLDAFASDAPPLHLATREAFALYVRRMSDDGVLAIHCSNSYLALIPLCKSLGAAVGLRNIRILVSQENFLTRQGSAEWVLLSRQPLVFPIPGTLKELDPRGVEDTPVITDDKGSVLPLLRWRGLLRAP